MRTPGAVCQRQLRLLVGWLVLLLTMACGGASSSSSADDEVLLDVRGDADAVVLPDLGGSDLDVRDTVDVDVSKDADTDVQLVCEPGAGGFMCPCTGNGDCLSGYCVWDQGDKVCTVACEQACAAGWTCDQAGVTDTTYICLSEYPRLCLPCAANADCQKEVGNTEVCVDYGPTLGSFCGGVCEIDGDCPTGYGCVDATTVESEETRRCKPLSGQCACSKLAIDGMMVTPCPITNEWGTCDGERECTAAGLTECSALTPAQEACYDGVDNDCDDLIDLGDHEDCDKPCICGDGTCEPARCGEAWEDGTRTCAADCAECGNGTCDPGEGPGKCFVDCCGGCGDGKCRGGECGENPVTCPQDCDFVCGDGSCSPGEGPAVCPQDCDKHACGNHVCEPTENPDSCPEDCGAACGDCECEAPEDYATCPVDCGYCGDDVCASACFALGESPATCTDCCVSSCEGKQCGDDGCGGSCGGCLKGKVCVSGTCLCVPVSGVDVTCNAIDDDCDGVTDEDWRPFLATCGTGACASSGMTTCAAGLSGTTCVPGPPLAALDVVCDLIDEDCDGQTDEDHGFHDWDGSARGLGEGCGTGACASGEVVCDLPSMTATCSTGTNAAAEDCNGLDDDCDGSTDEDPSTLCGDTDRWCDRAHCVTVGFRFIPAGSFWMGSPKGGDQDCPVGYTGGGCNGDGTGTTISEGSSGYAGDVLRYVRLTHDFELMDHEVTQGEWAALAATEGWQVAPSYFSSCGDDCPVERVSWFEAVAYANALSRREGMEECYALAGCSGTFGAGCSVGDNSCETYGCVATLVGGSNPFECEGYRLPREAEWEYAYRAGSVTTLYPSPDNDGTLGPDICLAGNVDRIAWYIGNSGAEGGAPYDCSAMWTSQGCSSECGLHPVRGRAPNVWGLFDLAGNLAEWTADAGPSTPTFTPLDAPTVDPWVDSQALYNNRLVRGGSFQSLPNHVKAAWRSPTVHGIRMYTVGFRLARTVNP